MAHVRPFGWRVDRRFSRGYRSRWFHLPTAPPGYIRRPRTNGRVLGAAVYLYAAALSVSWAAVEFTDRSLVATLVGFGPRWLAAVPLVPLTLLVIVRASARQMARLVPVLLVSTGVLLLGVMDFRVGRARAGLPASLRLMTQNLGGTIVDAARLAGFLEREKVDVAVLQECPFYDYTPAGRGWHFYYGGDLCVASRFPFRVLDLANPADYWQHQTRAPIRFEIYGPVPFQLMNVHFQTVREGLNALRTEGAAAVRQFEANRREASADSAAARARMRDVHEPFIVAGDFNLPVESAIYRANWADLRNIFSRCGWGLGHTKFTSVFGIRIDHVLASRHWECTDARVLPSPYEGDHAPLVVDLLLTPRRDS